MKKYKRTRGFLALLCICALMAGMFIPELPVQAKKVTVQAKLSYDTAKGRLSISMDDSWLADPSGEYSHSLARGLSGLSALMYHAGAGKAKKVLKKMGYRSFSYQKDDTGTAATYLLASRSASIRGEKYDILLVDIRGTENAEWPDNFNSGYGKMTHEGFQNAAAAVYEGIQAYIEEKGLDRTALKIIVTGHSRGAGAANLLGKRLDDEWTASGELDRDNIFVYTFASPNTTQDAARNSDSYDNIFNIVDQDDLVAKLLPEAWGYGRYGVTCLLPQGKTKKLKKLYKKATGRAYAYQKKNGKKLDSYLNKITETVTSNDEYYTKNLKTGEITTPEEAHSLKKMYERMFFATMGQDEGAFLVLSVEIMAGQWGDAGNTTMEFFSDADILSALVYTHGAESYAVKLQAYNAGRLEID